MTRCQLVIVGASWGGLQAVMTILRSLPADFPVPVLVVLHRSEDAGDGLAPLLDRAGALPAREVEDKLPLDSRGVLVAPAGYHVLVEPDHLALSTDAQVRFSRPSIDVALETAADALGPAAVGVVLTGNNEDGAAGLARVRRRGGIAVVQDPATAERPTMPAAARAAARPQVIAELSEIPGLLVRLASAEVGS
jgi:two-component system, chemotaxis family, protein-glutamate methylesterase/glutaminase